MSSPPPMGQRTVICGWNVAVDFYMGIMIFFVLLIPTCLFTTTVPLHDSMVALYGTTFGWVYLFTLLTLSAVSFCCLFITLLCDPGFVFPVSWASTAPQGARASADVIAEIIANEFDPDMCVEHCRVCHLYVDRFDHHCGILGACIGRRNLWSFVSFCSSVALLSLLAIPGSITFVYLNFKFPESVNYHQFLRMFPFDILCAASGGFASLYGGLYCFILAVHYVWLIWINEHSATQRRQRRNESISQTLRTAKGGWRMMAAAFWELRRMERTQIAIERELRSHA